MMLRYCLPVIVLVLLHHLAFASASASASLNAATCSSATCAAARRSCNSKCAPLSTLLKAKCVQKCSATYTTCLARLRKCKKTASPRKRESARSPSPRKRASARSPSPRKRENARSPSPRKRESARSPSPRKRESARSPSPRKRSPRSPRSGGCLASCATVRNTCTNDCSDLVGAPRGQCLKACGTEYTKCTNVCPPPPPPPANSVEVELAWDKIGVIDDGESGAAEPYMWTAFFKIDSTNTDFVGLSLKVKPGATLVTLAGDGRHGNVPQMDSSSGPNTKPLSSVFTYRTVLQPFTPLPSIKAAIVGSITVLLEEDAVTDDGALAGAQAFRAGIEKQLQKFVNGLTLAGGVQIPNLAGSIESVTNAVIQAIKDEQSFFENLGTLLGSPDDFLGSQVVITALADGVEGEQKGIIRIPNQTLTNRVTINSPVMNAGADGKWQLFGHVRRIKNN